jgi:hypothetical protein
VQLLPLTDPASDLIQETHAGQLRLHLLLGLFPLGDVGDETA